MSGPFDSDSKSVVRNKLTDCWFEISGRSPHDKLAPLVEIMWGETDSRRMLALHFARLYSNRMASALTGNNFSVAADGGAKIRMNITRSVIDTATAQISTQRSRPMFLTERGNFEQQDRAKKRGKFVTGWFHALKLYIEAMDAFRDGGIFGTGALLFYAHGGRILMERVLQDEFLVDEVESRVGRPQNLFRRSTVSRSRLAAMYPKFKKDIEEATWANDGLESEADRAPRGIPDPVTMYEAWHLPSIYGGSDGRHLICLDNCTLRDEKWERCSFPVVFWRWATPVVGFFGAGLSEELSPIQVELNFISQKIQHLMTLATTMIWLEKGSYSGKINNEDLGIREYVGRPPQFIAPVSVSAEYFGQMDRLWQRGHEAGGISLMSATSQKPAGLESGEALRVYNDIGSRRFAHTSMRWEDFFMQCGDQVLACAAEIVEHGGKDARVLGGGDKEMESLSYADVSAAPDMYIMKPHPISIIPDTPAGKIEAMKSMAAFAPEMASYLIATVSGIPDLEAAVALANAPRESAELAVHSILAKNTLVAPHPAMNLALTRDIAQRSLLRAIIDDVPEEKQRMLSRYIVMIDDMQKNAAAAGLAGPAGAGSPLVPNAPMDMTGAAPVMPDMQAAMGGMVPPGMGGGMMPSGM